MQLVPCAAGPVLFHNPPKNLYWKEKNLRSLETAQSVDLNPDWAFHMFYWCLICLLLLFPQRYLKNKDLESLKASAKSQFNQVRQKHG